MTAPSGCDARLGPFLAAGDEEVARELLGTLLIEEVRPLVRRIVSRQLGWRGRHPPSPHDLEDVEAGVLLRVSRHLMTLRAGGDHTQVADLGDYVAATAFNACASFHEARFPQRTRLRQRLRYLLTRDPSFALWERAPREWICSLAAQQRETVMDSTEADRVEQAAREAVAREGRANVQLPTVLRHLFTILGRPCTFASLLDGMATALELHDAIAAAPTEADLEPADSRRSSHEILEARQTFSRVWAEIVALPNSQRAALLLNLRELGGGDLLGTLLLAEVTTAREVAAALEMPLDSLESLLAELPLEDAAIANRLGVTSRQVINLRKSARARLGRRLRDLGGGW